MRDIKFRAWFPDWKEVHILSEMNGVLLNGDMELMTLEIFDDLVNGEHEQSEKWTEQPDAILMQFTGLTDKNGADIYEGDILLWEGRGGTEVVGWEQSTCSFTCFGRLCQMHLDNDEDGGGLIVIGNIHENPELLET